MTRIATAAPFRRRRRLNGAGLAVTFDALVPSLASFAADLDAAVASGGLQAALRSSGAATALAAAVLDAAASASLNAALRATEPPTQSSGAADGSGGADDDGVTVGGLDLVVLCALCALVVFLVIGCGAVTANRRLLRSERRSHVRVRKGPKGPPQRTQRSSLDDDRAAAEAATFARRAAPDAAPRSPPVSSQAAAFLAASPQPSDAAAAAGGDFADLGTWTSPRNSLASPGRRWSSIGTQPARLSPNSPRSPSAASSAARSPAGNRRSSATDLWEKATRHEKLTESAAI